MEVESRLRGTIQKSIVVKKSTSAAQTNVL